MDMEMTNLFHNIVEEAPFGIYVLDTERKIVYWSRGAERITGYSREEMAGCHCLTGGWTISIRKAPTCAMISVP